jgi:hypothetical protein
VTLNHRQHDALELAKERQYERARALADQRGIPRPPDSAIPELPVEDDPLAQYEADAAVLDPSAGRSKDEEDAWRLWLIEHPPQLDRHAEAEAIEQLELRRLEEMQKDGLDPSPAYTGPTRSDPRAWSYSQSRLGRS